MSDLQCHNCINRDGFDYYSYYECNTCGSPARTVEATPNEELRELIQQWRVKADTLIHEGSEDGVKNDYVEGRGGQLIQAANELEALIDER